MSVTERSAGMSNLKSNLKRVPVVGAIARVIRSLYSRARFSGSRNYWEQRYATGGTSGDGSYGEQAVFKAEVLNDLVAVHAVHSVIEFGCGDGHQLSLAQYPCYIGLDVSKTAIDLCLRRFQNDETKSFFVYDPIRFVDHARLFHADVAISLEVIFHLVEDDVYEAYMRFLFASADRVVVIFSSDHDETRTLEAAHYRDRRFSTWIAAHAPEWRLLETIPNRYPFDRVTGRGATADFWIYTR